MKILVRGDCCCRRAIAMNRDLFGGNPDVTVDEKSRTDFFLGEAATAASADDVIRYFDVDAMSKSLRHYALGQTGRETLMASSADLLVMDNYADMNFKGWRHREDGWKMWAHPKFIRDEAAFDRDFEALGYLTFEESLQSHLKLIARYRERYGNVRILYLAQPIAYYRKLKARSEFQRLGAALEERVDDLYFGSVADSELEPDDMGSCGPGQTLHFTAETYRRMIAMAMDKGLQARLGDGGNAATAVAPSRKTKQPEIPDRPPPPEELPELTINFQRSDMSSKWCTSYADMLHDKFAAPHARLEGYGAYEVGASILVLPDSFEEWWEDVGYYTRRKVRKAEKDGYEFAVIERDQHLEDIFEINTSMQERQGREMTEAYQKRPGPFGALPEFSCPRHRLGAYGILLDGKLVAYTWVYQVGEMCLFSTILGHGDHLRSGVMFQLIAGVLQNLIPTSGTRYAMYNMHWSGTDGLRFFKERMGFRPYRVQWKRGDVAPASEVEQAGLRR